MFTVLEVGTTLADLCRKGEFEQAMTQLYSKDIVSSEPMGDPQTVKGIDAVMGKAQWWNSTYETHGVEVAGPYVNGDSFIVEFKLDSTNRQTNERSIMHEYAHYTVADGKIVRESFFYVG